MAHIALRRTEMNIREKEVMVQGKFKIGATVTYTNENKKSPAVVIIMGTGKLDRDGNGAMFRSNIYKDLAHIFAKHGFAAVRYDKRGTHKTEGSFSKAGLHDLVDDARSVVQYMKKLPYIDENNIIVCGHSEGTMIATLLSEREETAGLILLGGAGLSLKDALVYQNKLVAEEVQHKKGLSGAILRSSFKLEKQLAMLDEMFKKSKETNKTNVFVKGAMYPAKWLREHGLYTSEDYAAKLKKYGGPVLALTGTADIQADHHKLDLLNGTDHIRCCAPENVNHLLREIDDDNNILNVGKQYRRLLKQPLHDGTVKVICEWLKVFI